MSLEQRVAIVTGAGAGIGRSIALSLARDGASVVLNYRRNRTAAEAVAAAINALGGTASLFKADVADVEAIGAMVEAARERHGRVDIVVCSAGSRWIPQDLPDIDPSDLRKMLAIEVEGVFHLLRGVLPGMRGRGWGRIVLLGGYLADTWHFGPPEAPVDYPLGKAARHWLARTLSVRELAFGVTINAVALGRTLTVPLEDAIAAVQGGRRPSSGNHPQDVAELVAFLCSDKASRVTGAVIPMPGETVL